MAEPLGNPVESVPNNVRVITDDKHMPRARYRLINVPHPLDARITAEEVGQRKMNALCIELYHTKHPRMHVDEKEALEAFKFLEPVHGREHIPLYEVPLRMAHAAKARCFFTDMHLPLELIEKEQYERDVAVAAAKKTLMIAAMTGVVAAAAHGKTGDWLDKLFEKKVGRRSIVQGLGAIAGLLAAKSLPLTIQDLATPDDSSDARISERSIGRKAFRAARGAEESLDGLVTPTYLATMMLRNLCFAFKSRAAVALLAEDIPGQSHINAVLPMGWGHFGVEEAFKLSDQQLMDAMEAMADRIHLDADARASMYSLAEIRTIAPGSASAKIHRLKKERI